MKIGGALLACLVISRRKDRRHSASKRIVSILGTLGVSSSRRWNDPCGPEVLRRQRENLSMAGTQPVLHICRHETIRRPCCRGMRTQLIRAQV
jgi:hypothetical protein